MPEWEVRPATIEDRELAINLMRRASGDDPFRGRLSDWAIRRNLCTSDLYPVVADTGSGLAALCTATDPDYQRRGLFRTLTQALYDATRETSPIVFGFPNEQSAPTFYKHLGWVDVRPFPHLRRPLRDAGVHARSRSLAKFAALALERPIVLGATVQSRSCRCSSTGGLSIRLIHTDDWPPGPGVAPSRIVHIDAGICRAPIRTGSERGRS